MTVNRLEKSLPTQMGYFGPVERFNHVTVNRSALGFSISVGGKKVGLELNELKPADRAILNELGASGTVTLSGTWVTVGKKTTERAFLVSSVERATDTVPGGNAKVR